MLKKFSKIKLMREFIAENLLALFSLFIAILGGFPGFITVINYFKGKASFSYLLQGVLTGKSLDENTSMIMLSGIVSNHGKEPLIPNSFDLEIKIESKWKKMNKTLIPINTRFDSTIQNIQYDDPWEHDLQKIKAVITQSNPMYGHLMFITNEQIPINLNTEFKLICLDNFGRRYKYKFKNDRNNELSVVIPKFGITVKSK